MRIIILGIALCLWPLSALAGNWVDGSDGERVITTLSAGQWAWYDPASNTDDSPILDVSQCAEYTALSFDDKDGDGTVCSLTLDVEMCPDRQDVLNDATKRNNACELVPATSSLGPNDDGSFGFEVQFLRVNITGGSNATDCRIQVHCSRGAK